MARAYDVIEVEKKWQQRWADEGTYEVDADDPRPPWYVLTMYPYPSGPAHMGHVRNYTFGDLLVRHRTMLGYAVLSPFGFDSFGLPAENAAIKTGTHPRDLHRGPHRRAEGVDHLARRRLRLAPRDPQPRPRVHQVEPGHLPAAAGRRPGLPGQRPGQLVPGLPDRAGQRAGAARRHLRALRRRGRASATSSSGSSGITDYADELLADLDALDWPERVKTMQRNWIGRSEGAEFDLVVEGRDGSDGRQRLALRVFTTRPDTSFGMTYAVVAPEHPLVDELTTPEHRAEVEELRARAAASTDVERMSESGADQPGQARRLHRLVGDQPVHRPAGAGLRGRLRADGLRHRRHHGRARRGRPRLGLRPGLRPAGGAHRPAARGLGGARGPDGGPGGAYTGAGEKINSDWLDGLDIPTAKARAIDWLEAEGIGTRTVNYRLRDWLVSRQRFWGCPIPVVYCPDHGIVPVPADQLPVLAPDDVEFLPTGESPLATNPEFLHTTCPICGGPGHPRDRHHGHLRRLVVVLPALHRPVDPGPARSTRRSPATGCRSTSTSAGSSTPSSTCSTPASTPRPWPTSAWPPTGCASRSPALRPGDDPDGRDQDVQVQGQPGGPVELPDHRRAPTPCGCSTSSSGPPADDVDWTDQTDSVIDGLRPLPRPGLAPGRPRRRRRSRAARRRGRSPRRTWTIRRATHRLIDRVTRDFERWSYNTAVAACMEFVNLLQPYVRDGGQRRGGRRGGRHPAAAAGPDDPARDRRGVGAPARRPRPPPALAGGRPGAGRRGRR